MTRTAHLESGLRAAFSRLARTSLPLVLLLWAGLGSAAWAQSERLAAWQARADALTLDQHPVWHALLHLDRGHPNVQDPAFLLSSPDFSPAAELATLLRWIDTEPAAAACRFPARYDWLRAALPLPPPDRTLCPKLAEFLARAPGDHVILAFASENVAQPASMMGHTFLVLRGEDREGRLIDHAVSFYTDTDTFNVAKLLYDSLVTGKEGLFSLIPYDEARRLYVRQEQRALWEFPLLLDEEARHRLVLHLHELRDTRLTYFFQGYNCATLVKHVLAVAHPEILQRRDPWTTPKDVVQHAAAIGLLGEGTIEAPAQWRIAALVDALPPAATTRVRSALREEISPHDPRAAPDQDFLALELARAYAEALPDTPQSAQTLRLVESDLQRFHGQRQLSIDRSADPRQAPPDAQVSIGVGTVGHRSMLQLDLLPISHHLEDWGQQGAAETALSLFELSVRQPVEGGAPRLHRLVLYGITSLLPHDPLVGGLSGKLTMGLDDDDPAVLQPRLHGRLEGQVGRTWRWHRDVDVYAMLGGGLYGRAGLQLRTQQEAGLLVREAFGLKTHLSVATSQHPAETARHGTVWQWTQSKRLRADLGLVLSLRHQRQRDGTRNDALLQLRWRY